MKPHHCLIAVLGIINAISTSQAAYLVLKQTPYDRQMAAVHHILHQHNPTQSGPSLSEVNSWMREIRGYAYRRSHTWQGPDQTQSRRAGDCKDKAILLLDHMKKAGAKSVRLVIGKKSASSTETHAWLEWGTPQGKLILDPTFDSRAQTASKRQDYIPQYAYAGSRKYAVVDSEALIANL